MNDLTRPNQRLEPTRKTARLSRDVRLHHDPTSDTCEQEKGTGYFSGDVLGRSRWRSADSRPNVAAMVACQSAVPKGCWRFT